jgi:hypothetical protein
VNGFRLVFTALVSVDVVDTVGDVIGLEPNVVDGDRGVSVSDQAERSKPLQRRATIMSDSASAGIRWNGALGGLQGFEVGDRLESCRRLVVASCQGREGRCPNTLLVWIGLLPRPDAREVLIIASGYNDLDVEVAVSAREVLDAALATGDETIAWVTYRVSVDYLLLLDQNVEVANHEVVNEELYLLAAQDEHSVLQLWDLTGDTRTAFHWFNDEDGVHQKELGSWGVADWVSRKMAQLDGRPCPMPRIPTFPQDQVHSARNVLRILRGLPDIDGLYELWSHN